MTIGILDKTHYGYDEIEPVIVALFATGKNFLLIGRHGTGKSRLARELANSLETGGYVYYDATKEDMLSIAGVPNPEEIKQGRFAFTSHQRSIWDKKTIVVDEISRANRESQNLWLEILEERSCFGIPLDYHSVIATANPESYAAAFQLDEALLDRFYAVVPVPDHQTDMTPERVEALLERSFAPAHTGSPNSAPMVLQDIRREYQANLSGETGQRIRTYVSVVTSLILRHIVQDGENSCYLSPRVYGKVLPETIAAIAAYFSVAGHDAPIEEGAWQALRYVIVTRLGVSDEAVRELHLAAVESMGLSSGQNGYQFRLAIHDLNGFQERLSYLEQNVQQIYEQLPRDELERFLGSLLGDATRTGHQRRLVKLSQILHRIDYQGDILRQVDGQLLLLLNRAITFILPELTSLLSEKNGELSSVSPKIARFRDMVKRGEIGAVRNEDMGSFKESLVDIYEGRTPITASSITDMFGSVELPQAQAVSA